MRGLLDAWRADDMDAVERILFSPSAHLLLGGWLLLVMVIIGALGLLVL